ncbi:uncharacterized protein LOC100203247 [Hydra vulgaris]|uniref:uncharacterized protein LOC100203247 n=1 Tax=Hydra vulgaris TaxID=6087 RepID=UPI00064131E2|nr:uncharacterized protein LOC100203247 [Hydra vulgaris]
MKNVDKNLEIITMYFLFVLISQSVAFGQHSANLINDIITVPKVSSCNNRYTNQTFGIITSPNYPYGYHANTECTWVIDMPKEDRVVLTIKKFNIGPKDKLNIIDANDSTLYNLTNDPGDIIFSNSNKVTIQLVSSEENFYGNRTFYSIFEREGCGGVLTNKNGYISVPSYVYMSPTPHECSWTILAPQNKVLSLQFLQFDLPPGSCLYSNIYIREGSDEAGYILGDFCEENPPMNQLRTATNILRILYRTRPNELAARTELLPSIKMFYVQEDACGGLLDGYSGSFTLPLRWLEDVYSCNWTITVPHGKHMTLKFKAWKSYESSDGDYDELRFILPQRNVVYWKSFGKNSPPENMLVPSNSLVVSLISHRNNSVETKLRLNCLFQAIAPVEEQCVDIAGRKIFICDEWKYIDCSLRCDGVFDCHNKKDEKYCLENILDEPIAMQHANEVKHLGRSSLFIGLFTITCLIVVIAFISITADRFCRKLFLRKVEDPKESKHSNISPNPPPYKQEDYQIKNSVISSSVQTLNNFTQTSETDEHNQGENLNYLRSYKKKYRNETYPSRSKSSTSCNRRQYLDLSKRSTFSLNLIPNLRYPQNVDFDNQNMSKRQSAISAWEFSNQDNSRHLCASPQQNYLYPDLQNNILTLNRTQSEAQKDKINSTTELQSEKENTKTLEKPGCQVWNYESDFEECSSTSISSKHASVEQLLSSDNEMHNNLQNTLLLEMFHADSAETTNDAQSYNADSMDTTKEVQSSFSATLSSEL